MSIEVEIYEKIRYLHEHEGKSQRAILLLITLSDGNIGTESDGDDCYVSPTSSEIFGYTLPKK